MPSPFDYKAYFIMKALANGDKTAAEIAPLMRPWTDAAGGRPVGVRSIAGVIKERLHPAYVEVRGVRRPWKSRRGINVYGLTAEGRRFVDRYAARWEA